MGTGKGTFYQALTVLCSRSAYYMNMWFQLRLLRLLLGLPLLDDQSRTLERSVEMCRSDTLGQRFVDELLLFKGHGFVLRKH